MTFLLWFAAFIALVWLLAYFRATRWVWGAAGAAFLIGASLAGLPLVWRGVLWTVFIATAAVLLIPELRRMLVSDPLLGWFRRVLPQVSQTEQEALDAGTVWWDGDLFSGRPDWNKLLAVPRPTLTAEERAFLEGPVEALCGMVDEWKVTHELKDLPPEAWQFIKDQGFFGMIIPKQYGGLGFSALAHSTVVMKLASRSPTACVSVMVPNSLGPAELLLHYGTEEQKRYYLPRLAKGVEMPCFALTGPEAGSDAGSIPDYGIVCWGEHDGKRVLGMRVTWEKRYITLGPGRNAARPGLPPVRSGRSDRRAQGHRHHRRAHPDAPSRGEHRPASSAARRGVHERPELGQGCIHPDGLGGRRPGVRRSGLAHAHGVPGRGPLHFAAVVGGWRRQAGGARDRRLQPHPHAVPRPDRQVRGRRRGARPHRRQRLRDRGRARHDRGGRRSGREAFGGVGDRQVPLHRARQAGRQ